MNNEIITDPIILGKICSCYGIRGWVKILSSTEESNSILKYCNWFISRSDNYYQKVEIEKWMYQKTNIIVKFKNINDRNTASLLTNCKIIVDSSKLPKLKEGEYYWKDLIGCQIININGYNFGKIIYIFKTGSNDVLVVHKKIKNKYTKNDKLIPFIDEQVIKKIDLSTKIIIVDWNPNF